MKDNHVVIHIPHSSYHIPDFLKEDILLNDKELQENFHAFTDWRTKDLFSHQNFSCRIVSNISRMVCDMERFRDDAREEMAAHGYGAVYTRDAFLRPLRPADNVKRELILRLYYDPHHKRLTEAVREKIKRFGKCLIVDCHSFSGVPLPYEPEQADSRPSFCIGTVSGHTSGNLVRTAIKTLQSPDHPAALNYPYAGSMIPVEFFGDSRVQTIMIEVNRSLYQQHDSLVSLPRYRHVKNKLNTLLSALAAAF
jgi:N-formylglutamate amidohydrolase